MGALLSRRCATLTGPRVHADAAPAGRFADAKRDADAALAVDVDNVKAHYRGARAAFCSGELQECERRLQRVLESLRRQRRSPEPDLLLLERRVRALLLTQDQHRSLRCAAPPRLRPSSLPLAEAAARPVGSRLPRRLGVDPNVGAACCVPGRRRRSRGRSTGPQGATRSRARSPPVATCWYERVSCPPPLEWAPA
eukprot:scaffold2809_cov373-Prasinococcus_capsulatus_cf.AAC.4